MKEVTQTRFCNNCGKETVHMVRESAVDIEYTCRDCDKQEEIVKTFF
ncbi:hypothetical protein [Peribacillus sp. SCS-155]